MASVISESAEPYESEVRVLVVDDVPTNRAVIKSLLARPSYHIFEAANGQEALDLANANEFDLVILDVLMPGMGGLEVLRHIRERYSESELPVLILTVKDEIEDVVKGLELGANDYVTRPIDYSVLVARINTLISYKQTQDAVRQSQAILEHRITERTNELLEANRALRAEVAERKHAEEQARLSQMRYQLLYDDTPSMFLTINADGIVESMNRYGAEQLGYEVEELVGMHATELHSADEREHAGERLRLCLDEPNRLHRWETCLHRKDRSPVWVRKTARVIDGEEHGTRSVLVVCEDITEARTLSEQLSYQAKHDSLTGLVNRREFELRMQRALERARRSRTRHALCYMDLDQFKIVNDTCGHVAGDELLRQLGAVLQNYIGADDTLARLGGDEFAVLLMDSDLDRAVRVAKDLSQAIQEYRFTWGESSFSIAASIGLVPIDYGSDSVADVLAAADTACYAAKDEGRNLIHVYEKNDAEVVKRHGEMAWIRKIHGALENDNFSLYYQPIVPVSSETDAGRLHYELLVRMEDEDGVVVPDVFLPAVERYKHAVRLDRWVVNHALSWLADHPDHVADLYLCSLNLSGQSLSDQDFLRFILDTLDHTGIPPHKLCFEVTETAAIENLASATRFIKEIRGRKCRFALDDFGSGLSSFAYLKNLPVDFIKIDGLFIRDITTDPIDWAMARSINEIAKVMGKHTIAEFVENSDTLAELECMGVDYAQGNAIAVPRPLNDILTQS